MSNLNATAVGKIIGAHRFGREFYGVFRGDAAAGADIPLFLNEDGTTVELAETDRVAVTWISCDGSADGEAMVYVDNDGDDTEDANEIVWRGHIAAGGGSRMVYYPPRCGIPGAVPRCKGPNILNVQIGGYIF